jgi:hypothetical protein
LVERSVKLREKKLEPERPDTLTSRNILTLPYVEVGQR